MVSKIKDCIILGGGKSIEEGISLGLKDYLKDKFVIACNYSFLYFPHTILTCCDREFYQSTNLELHPNISHQLEQEPLIISCMKPLATTVVFPNTIVVNRANNYSTDPLKHGYLSVLCGLFSLHLASTIHLDRIWLFGMDWTQRTEETKQYKQRGELDIHFYNKEVKHRGIGYTGYFDNHNPNNYFRHFEHLNIINVSPNSNIKNFKKTSYATFFKAKVEGIEQEEVRGYIKETMKGE